MPVASLLAMFCAVWLLYAADRLLDARVLDRDPFASELKQRHHFHHRHRGGFLWGIAAAVVLLAFLLPGMWVIALRLYLTEGALLIGYFVLIHTSGTSHRIPKELTVGVFFSAAVFVPTVARRPDLQRGLLPAALLLAGVFALNGLLISSWESSERSAMGQKTRGSRRGHWLARPRRRAASLIFPALLGATGVVLATAGHGGTRPLPCAATLSLLLLLLLDRGRHRLRPLTLRAAADLVLLTPLVSLLARHAKL